MKFTKPLKYCKPNRPNVFVPLTAYQKKMMSFSANFNYNNCPFHFHKLRTRNQHEGMQMTACLASVCSAADPLSLGKAKVTRKTLKLIDH